MRSPSYSNLAIIQLMPELTFPTGGTHLSKGKLKPEEFSNVIAIRDVDRFSFASFF
jgi:hypothetical protein